MTRFQRILAWGLFSLVLLVLSGWLLADHFTPRAVGAPSHALALRDAQTALDREIAPLVAEHGGKTGAILVPDGLDAFAARALSARQAGRSLDLQYYIWHDDLTGRLLARETWLAAERGVRVRLLLDDLNGVDDDALLALDSHRNIEIRVYNPLRNRKGPWRVLEMVQRLYSMNHRMHNKAWIADGRVAVLGGRNIGAEYFDAGPQTNFRDLDILLFGPKVAQASAIFDAYWNSDAAVPVSALAQGSQRDLDAQVIRTRAEARTEQAHHYLQRMEQAQTVRGYFDKQLAPIWSDGIEVVADPPLKWKRDRHDGWLATRLAKMVAATQHKALLISPYFVPGDAVTEGLIGLVHDRHAFVGVVTNSLAATDVAAVHAGYAEYREPLLSGGVHLYELRSQAPADGHGGSAGPFGSSGASLHTKAFVVDDRYGFVGSFNLDPRSINLNTEMGVLFDDPRLARGVREEYLRLAAPKMSYWVFVDKQGELRWLDRDTDPSSLRSHEPDTSRWQRTVARVVGWLPIESQL